MNIPILAGSRQQIVQRLRQEVHRLEGGRLPAKDGFWATGCPVLGRLLPAGQLPRGVLVEWLGGGGTGAGTLALLAARQACQEGGWLAVLDRQGQFYPPAAAALGIDLERVLVIRTARQREEVWALDQALSCPAVAAVWAAVDKLEGRQFRRLQLAAERSGSLGLLLRPAGVRGQPSWAAVQLQVEPLASGGGRRLRVEVVRSRGGGSGRAVELEIDETNGAVQEVMTRNETDSLRLDSQLADPATRRRSARA